MPHVKILFVKENSSYDNDDYLQTSAIVMDSITDWEEITQEELNLLYNYRYSFSGFSKNGYNTVILVKDEQPVVERISSIKEWLIQIVEKQKKQEAERKKKEKQKSELLKKTKAEREKKKLLELAKKHGIDLTKIKDTKNEK